MTAIGLLLGIAVISLAISSSGASPSIFWNPVGIAIVLGGTLSATLFSFDSKQLSSVFRALWIVLINPKEQLKQDARDLVEVSRLWVNPDVRAVSKRIDSVKSPFFRIGLKLLADGMTSTQTIVDTLQWRIDSLRKKEDGQAHVFRSMAAFAPAFGMMGTLFGLINMLRNTDTENLNAITSGMAVALMTTLYGILFANLFFKPIANKLEQRTRDRIKRMTLLLESTCLMSQTRSASVLEEIESAMLVEFNDELGHEPPSENKGNW